MLRTEVLREVTQWWQSLSIAAKAMLVGTTMLVVAALAVWTYTAYCTPPVVSTASSTLTNNRISPFPARGLLSLPLPGTRRRDEVELGQRLETALAGFDDVAEAQVVVADSLSPSANSSDSLRLSLQLRLSSSAAPAAAWTENLVTFVLHTVPGLQPADLLIADSSGRLLFAHGQVVPPAAATLPPSAADNSPPAVIGLALPGWQVIMFAGGCLVIILALYILLRRRPAATEPSEELSLTLTEQSPTQAALQFLERLNSHQIVNLLEGERPEVADLATHYLADEDMVRQVRQELGLPVGGLAASQRPVRDDILASLAAALHTKLSTWNKTGDSQLAPAIIQPVSGGDYDE